MESEPGLNLRGGDRGLKVICACGGVAHTLPPGQRVVLPPAGVSMDIIAACCGRRSTIRVEEMRHG